MNFFFKIKSEWHTWPQDNLNLIPVPVRDQVIGWYLKAFNKTKLQVRYYKNTTKAYPGNIGLHDDSFTYETLDDQNDPFSEYFWPEVVRGKQTDFWKKSVMVCVCNFHLNSKGKICLILFLSNIPNNHILKQQSTSFFL